MHTLRLLNPKDEILNPKSTMEGGLNLECRMWNAKLGFVRVPNRWLTLSALRFLC